MTNRITVTVMLCMYSVIFFTLGFCNLDSIIGYFAIGCGLVEAVAAIYPWTKKNRERK